MTQHVSSPTHTHDRTGTRNLLDILASFADSTFVNSVSVVSSHFVSDHSLIVAELNFRRPKPSLVTYCYRDLKHMDYAAFQNKLGNCSIITSPPENVDQYVAVLNTELNSLLDEFCPLKAGRRPNATKSRRWLSPEAVEAKRTRRRLERR